ncbi:MAG: hypothetical protein QGG36_11250 [Pirellulaceae bacterium]|jgi:hypothetical protein|nr:hypothetical protein [Pirellulaceae bacterium]MDP7016370.1 hypothetical protein [Pirellulaceae bacterium]
MVTRSVTDTPFGFRLTYAFNGEDFWTEYITVATPPQPTAKTTASGLRSSPAWAAWLNRLKATFALV